MKNKKWTFLGHSVVQWPLTTGHSKEGLGLGESMYQTSNFGSALMVLATVIFIHLYYFVIYADS